MYFLIFILFRIDIPVSKRRPCLGLHFLPMSQIWDARLISHLGNGQLGRCRCTVENQYDLSRRTSWHVYINKHAVDRVTKFNVSLCFYFNFGCKSENVIYAVAMNMDNTDTSITWKNWGSLQILHLAYKNEGFKMLCHDSVCLCYATLPFFLGYYQSK